MGLKNRYSPTLRHHISVLSIMFPRNSDITIPLYILFGILWYTIFRDVTSTGIQNASLFFCACRYMERDPVRGKDSFAAFEEMLLIAKKKKASVDCSARAVVVYTWWCKIDVHPTNEKGRTALSLNSEDKHRFFMDYDFIHKFLVLSNIVVLQ